jgi:serine phosphatase RsbU (regulator of sigma subunit)
MIHKTEQKIDFHAMQCSEVWGGNRAIESAVSVVGIDAWLFSRPYADAEQGGDIHYISHCGHGMLSRFTIADVAGHGQGVAHLSDRLNGLMHEHINALDQAEFARSLNREFSALTTAGGFATAVLTTYFAPTDQLITVNAGHPTPLWYRSASKHWQTLRHDAPDRLDDISNLPLGVIDPTEYVQFAVQLDKGDLVLIYTDSLIEAKDPADRPLGEQGLLDIVQSIDPTEPDRFHRRLLDAVDAYRQGASVDDDVTLLILHHNAANPPT